MSKVIDCDLAVRGGRVIDTANEIDDAIDIAVRDGRIVAAGYDLNVRAEQVLNASTCLVIPGAVDTEVHVPVTENGHVAHGMLARAGVTTALDLFGPIDAVLKNAAKHGAGLTIACIDCVRPNENVSGSNPSRFEVQQCIQRALAAGAIGVKIHVDQTLTPDATAIVIEEGNRARAWVAQHCGTTATASDMTGLRETIELVGAHRLQIAHINSYCRGYVDEPTIEAQEAIQLLRHVPQVFSGSYLAAGNGTWGGCRDGVVIEKRVRETWLPAGGYPGTPVGLRQAIRDGYVHVLTHHGDAIVASTGMDAVAVWEAAGTHIGISFPVNPASSRLMLAISKDACGRFDVDALTTDGGGNPRNNLIEAGLTLVQFGAMTLREWVHKTSWVPSRVLGLREKGHLGEGADADITIVDPMTRQVRTTIADGEVVMHEGVVFGTGSRFVTTAAGKDVVEQAGCRPIIVDIAESGFYTGDGLKA